jgi:hypothetical protein
MEKTKIRGLIAYLKANGITPEEAIRILELYNRVLAEKLKQKAILPDYEKR